MSETKYPNIPMNELPSSVPHVPPSFQVPSAASTAPEPHHRTNHTGGANTATENGLRRQTAQSLFPCSVFPQPPPRPKTSISSTCRVQAGSTTRWKLSPNGRMAQEYQVEVLCLDDLVCQAMCFSDPPFVVLSERFDSPSKCKIGLVILCLVYGEEFLTQYCEQSRYKCRYGGQLRPRTFEARVLLYSGGRAQRTGSAAP